MAQQRGWMEAAAFAASDPGRVAVLAMLAQAGLALDELALAQNAGLIYQRITGAPIETAGVVKHAHDLAAAGMLERDETGFRWKLTSLGVLISRQWAPEVIEPSSGDALTTDEIRGWRDKLVAQLAEDGELANEIGIAPEELLASQTMRLAELRVLNRVLGEEELPDWVLALAGRA